MAEKLRHWREKDGRFYARVSVPEELVSRIGRSELIETQGGGDRRSAMRQHPAAVARLQAQITRAGMEVAQTGAAVGPQARFPMTDERMAARFYQMRLELDDAGRLTKGYAAIGIDDGYVAALRAARTCARKGRIGSIGSRLRLVQSRLVTIELCACIGRSWPWGSWNS